MSDSLTGGCLCGKVRFALSSEPMIIQACHCETCRRAAGAPFVVNMWIEADRVDIQGEVQQYRAEGGSGKPVDMFFCDDCGTTILSKYHAAPDNSLFVRAACLDDPSLAPPSLHVHTESKLHWLILPEDARQFTAFYNPFKEWSEESVQRFKAIT